GYGSFQSHNHKVVSNENGIFMTHLRRANKEYTAQTWVLSRSTDGGKSFATVYESTNATSSPVLEADEGGMVLDARPDFVDGHAMRSPDGGATWQTQAVAALKPPIVADDTGPADRISLDDEFEVHSWLSAFLAKDRKLHLVYWAKNSPQRQHYVRYDGASGS